MATVEKSIDVAVPVSVAYDQWTQFEQFPQFMVLALRDRLRRTPARLRSAARAGDGHRRGDEPTSDAGEGPRGLAGIGAPGGPAGVASAP